MNFTGIDSIPGLASSSHSPHPDREPRARDAEPGECTVRISSPTSPQHPGDRNGHAVATGAQPWHLFWGATHDEVSRPLPGDELIASPLGTSTRCISIDAAPELVWRHAIAQLFGTSSLRSAPRIGAMTRLQSGTMMQVREAIPSSHLLLFQMIDLESGRVVGPEQPTPRRRMEWGLSLIIESNGEGGSRLIIRSRMDNAPRRIVSAPLDAILDMRHFATERSLLVDVKRSAERSAREAVEHSREHAAQQMLAAGRSAA